MEIIKNFDHIESTIKGVAEEIRLFAFILIDNRESNKSAFRFINDNQYFQQEKRNCSNKKNATVPTQMQSLLIAKPVEGL